MFTLYHNRGNLDKIIESLNGNLEVNVDVSIYQKILYIYQKRK